ncbi:type I restriction-modification system subunit M [Cyclobacterium sp. SYSU L10401]|uniref:type I restriction-modification system subunit M n=1 Tax=Cyclobacterium sp. SYSU L10401 TaxID=2678657 RepID=UPI0013D1551B|nr:class I SAM-dependent DNA methyltransferase [Cyclobacterium sp. SYSU L10401]
MTQADIKNLEKELWDAADELRGNSKLTAAEYKDPLLGLVLLRFAQNRYEDAKIQVERNLAINPRTGEKRAATKDDYAAAGAILLPEKAKYEYLVALPESEDIAEAINNAMKLIEAEYPDLAGILPKSYQEFDAKLLRDLVRVFNADAVRNAKGDVFGRIYEFFLMKFSMQGAGAQEGGEFFTPPSLVNLIIHFIQPNQGIIHDPACGSGGMFVQTAHFIKDHDPNRSVNEAITVYGTELKSNNAKLAKMNLAIHGIEGKILESNSFYTNPFHLTGKCDFVMANPPFNVDRVDAKNKFLTEDDRLPFGAPLTGKGTIGNGNYLWAQYFYSYLNETGRAGFVMASSATDAGNAEKLIRQKLIETGHVECIVSVGNNFFYTRSLPCHLWFYNKGKKPENKNKILMIDARKVFRKVTTTINDFSEEHMFGLTAIMNLFRGDPADHGMEHVTGSEVEGWFKEHFPKGQYQDVEGLCKVVDLEEVIAQDYSLTPGRYVGVNIELDMDFDYQGRIKMIHSELAELNNEANKLMSQIQSINL